MGVMYATREQVMSSLEVLNSAYAGAIIDNKILAASRSAEGFLHRRFYPERRTILVDWPNRSSSPSWEIDLGDQEMISVETVNSGGTAITSDVILRRSDNLAEPPYNKLQIDLSSDAAFTSGSTWQQSLSLLGLFGYNDTATNVAGGALNGAINSSVATVNIEPSNGEFTLGVGSLLLCGTERMLVIARRMVTTTFTTTSVLVNSQSANSFTSASASSNFAAGEIILIDAERMKVNEVAGNTVIVTRAWDGTVLATHGSGSTIYALREFVVYRGALGSTAASHSDADPVYVHAYPTLLTELVVAETVVMLQQGAAGYARTIGTGTSSREAVGKGLDDIRQRAWMELGRKSRSAAV